MNSSKIFSLNEISISSVGINSLKQLISEKILDGINNNSIITFNLDFLFNTTRDNKFKDICQNATLVFPDGVGITSLIYLKYGKKINRITGTDIFNTILLIAEEHQLKIALLGSSDSAHKKIISKLNHDFPNIKIVSALSPPFNFEVNEKLNEKVLNELETVKPDILIVALGSPRQEYWIEKNKQKIGAKLNVGVGAVLDYFSGEKIRAPNIFQLCGLEWFWRLLYEPKRLYRRYLLKDIPFYFKMIAQIIKEK